MRNTIRWMALVTIIAAATTAVSQDAVVLLEDAGGNTVAVASPLAEEGTYQLLIHDEPAIFADLDQKFVAVTGVDVVEVDGEPILRLFTPDGAAVDFAAAGIAVHPDPPGYLLIDRDGEFVETGFDGTLFIGDSESPGRAAPAVSEAAAIGTLFDFDVDSLLTDARRRLLENPDSANRILQSVLRDERLGILTGLKLEFVVIDSKEGQSTIGVSYDYARTVTPEDEVTGTVFKGWDLDFIARGTVAAEPELNRSNFLESRLEYKYFRSTGGVREDTEIPSTEVLQERLDRLRRMADMGDSYRTSEDFRIHSEEVRSIMTPQFHFDVGLSGGLEGNQDFSEKNWTYGLQALVDFKAWNPHSDAAKLNIFDLPFALVRLITGYDQSWQVRGSTYPTVLAAIDQVYPKGNEVRDALDDGSYGRFRGEASFRTPIAWFGESQVFFGANYRYYLELAPSDAVQAAGYDDFSFFTMSVTTDKGFLVTYKTGSLPFDVQDDSGFELGWKFKL